MSAFLDDVAARAFPRADAIQPRLPTLFERVTPEDSPVLMGSSVASTAPVAPLHAVPDERPRIEAIDAVLVQAREEARARSGTAANPPGKRRAGFSPPGRAEAGRAEARPTSVDDASPVTLVERVLRETQIEHTESTNELRIEHSTTTTESHTSSVIPSVSEGPGRELQQARESPPTPPERFGWGQTPPKANERCKWGQTPFTANPPRIPGVGRAQVASVAPQPTVNVSIGRIEVRASAQQQPRKSASATPREPSLEEYLRRRDGRQGR